MLATAEASHEFVTGPRRSFRLSAQLQSSLTQLPSLVIRESGASREVEFDEDSLEEPIDQARMLLAEVVRLGYVDVSRFPESASLRTNLARSLFNAGSIQEAETEAVA